MRGSLRYSHVFSVRSADYPTDLIRPFIAYSGAAAIRRPAAYSPTPVLLSGAHIKPYSMSSSGDQQQPEEASASAEVPLAETAGASSAAKTEPELPPLSPQEFRAYNRLAETMDYFVCT
jgi:hypothetical protein